MVLARRLFNATVVVFVVFGSAVVSLATRAAAPPSYWAIERPAQTADWKVVSFKDEYWPEAEFKGEYVVRGTITADWVPAEPGSEGLDWIQVLIHVSHDIKTTMPTLRQPDSKAFWNSEALIVRDAEAAIRLAFRSKVADDFLAKRAKSLKADGEFTIDNYILTTGCQGFVHSSVKLVDAKLDVPSSADPEEPGTC
jgi:hypothetical protein